ncbi:MAG: hypothetical protein M0Q42_08260 [Xanthomonadales bacterium]|nr:hypothetical protein [Xanthomonadales bacterium]
MSRPAHDPVRCTDAVASDGHRNFNAIGLAGLCGLVLGLLAAPAWAGTPLVVTNFDDSGPGSLRAHILSANAAGTPQRIEFAVTGVIVPTSRLPEITGDVTLQGPGIDGLSISGNHATGLMKVGPTGELRVLDLSLVDGQGQPGDFVDNFGAAVANHGRLVLERVRLRGNVAVFGGAVSTAPAAWTTIIDSELALNTAHIGGALYSENGRLEVFDSTLHGNHAHAEGGAIAAVNPDNRNHDATNEVLIGRSSLRFNHADSRGGGLYNQGRLVIIQGSTFEGNQALDSGGGIRSVGVSGGPAGATAIYNSTLSGNLAPAGTGSAIDATTVQGSTQTLLFHVTVANLEGGAGWALRGPISARHSLLADAGGNCAPGPHLITNLDGSLASDGSCPGFAQATLAQLALAPLADNGGPTRTHALKPGSAAIDSIAGCDDSETTSHTDDQRGVARPVDGDGDGIALCDAGAYEANDLLFVSGFEH